MNGLQTLIELQEVQIAIREQEDCLDRVPIQISQLQEQLSDLARELEQAALEVEEIRKRRRLVEGEVDLIKQKLSRFRDQLMEVKTNKEYQAVLKEIALAEEEISRNEDRILEEMLAIDEMRERTSEVEVRRNERQAEVDARRTELEAEADEARSELGQLKRRLVQLLDAIPTDLKVIYDRISAARNGLALAAVQDGSCQVCHVRLRPQLTTELKTTTEKLITCESCNRILYYPRVAVAENPTPS